MDDVVRLNELLRRPLLWPEAVRAAWSHRRRRWWASFPFSPRPSSSHLSWRRATAYGSSAHPVEGPDLVAYLRWRRRMRRAGR